MDGVRRRRTGVTKLFSKAAICFCIVLAVAVFNGEEAPALSGPSGPSLTPTQADQPLPDLVVDDILERSQGVFRFTVRVYNQGNGDVDGNDGDIVVEEWIAGAQVANCRIVNKVPSVPSSQLSLLAPITDPSRGNEGVRIRWSDTDLPASQVLEVTIECPTDEGPTVQKVAVVDPPLSGLPDGRIEESDPDNNRDADMSRDSSIPAPSQNADLERYDRNGNRKIDDDEFIEAMNDWLDGDLSDSAFFDLMDAWINGEEIGAGSSLPPVKPPELAEVESATSTCEFTDPGFGPCRNLQMSEPEATLDVGLDLEEPVTLPAGTRLELEIAEPTGTLDIARAGTELAGLEGSFTHAGDVLLGHFVANQALTLSPNQGLFRLLLATATTAARQMADLQIAGTWTTPTGAVANFTWNIQILVILSSLELEGTNLSVTRLGSTSPDTFVLEATGSGIQRLELNVFDLDGQLVKAKRSRGATIRGSWATMRQEPLANGIYFYRVTAYGPHGQRVQGRLVPIALLR
jgi:hypothetical protein